MKAQPKPHTGASVVRIEAEALRELADRISGSMAADFERWANALDQLASPIREQRPAAAARLTALIV